MRLFTQFILRPLVGDKIRTATTVLGVALGIAVVVAIQLTNASSVRGFETALETVAGKTAVEMVGTGGIDETVLPSLGWLREYGVVSPVIEGNAALVVGDLTLAVAARPRGGARARHRHPARHAVSGLPVAGHRRSGSRQGATAGPGGLAAAETSRRRSFSRS